MLDPLPCPFRGQAPGLGDTLMVSGYLQLLSNCKFSIHVFGLNIS